MRILILGGDGMLGHRLLKDLSQTHQVRVTLRQERHAYSQFALFTEENSYTGVDVRVTDRLVSVLADFHPEAVINAVGVVKQRKDGLDPIPNLEINALLPHRLAALCKAIRAHLIHISTDCVFSGRTGGYAENDQPDPIDVYGHSKLLGEVTADGCITLRTSIIGPELWRRTSLLEWFLAQKGRALGYRNAIFSGLTTLEMGRIMERLVTNFPQSAGIYHVSSQPISKFELLTLIRDKFGLSIELAPDDAFHCDRSLNSERFRRNFNYEPPTWAQMIDELAADHRSRKAS
ncbi:MAG: SDR family oxidoreductase [Burkholderiales bacterium]|nr:SDR family oxidoreductase [Burkholderiales bacterium]